MDGASDIRYYITGKSQMHFKFTSSGHGYLIISIGCSDDQTGIKKVKYNKKIDDYFRKNDLPWQVQYLPKETEEPSRLFLNVEF